MSVPTPTTKSIPIKCVLDKDCRRFSLPKPCYQTLLNTLRICYGASLPADFVLKFADEEDELCTISSTNELEEAFSISSDMGKKVLKVFVIIPEKSAAPSIPASISSASPSLSVESFASSTSAEPASLVIHKRTSGQKGKNESKQEETVKLQTKDVIKALKAEKQAIKAQKKADKALKQAEKKMAKARVKTQRAQEKASVLHTQSIPAASSDTGGTSLAPIDSSSSHPRVPSTPPPIMDWILDLFSDYEFIQRLPEVLSKTLEVFPTVDNIHSLVKEVLDNLGLKSHALVKRLLPHLDQMPRKAHLAFSRLKSDPYTFQRISSLVPQVSMALPVILPSITQWIRVKRDQMQRGGGNSSPFPLFPFLSSPNCPLFGPGGILGPETTSGNASPSNSSPATASTSKGTRDHQSCSAREAAEDLEARASAAATRPNPWAHLGGDGSSQPGPRPDQLADNALIENCTHPEIQCDGCDQVPLRGMRYKCNVCPNYDLCSRCHQSKSALHHKDHTFSAIPPLLPSDYPYPPQPPPYGMGLRRGRGCGRRGPWGGRRGGRGHWAPYMTQLFPMEMMREGKRRAAAASAAGSGFYQPPHMHGHTHTHPHHRHFGGDGGRHSTPPMWRTAGMGGGGGSNDKACESEQGEHSSNGAVLEGCDDDATVRKGGKKNNCWKRGKPKARFLKELSLPGRSVVMHGQTLIKTWEVKNQGRVPWPEGTRLIFYGGHRRISAEEEYEVPLAQPGETVEVSAVINVPNPSPPSSPASKGQDDPSSTSASSSPSVSRVAGDRTDEEGFEDESGRKNRFQAVFRLADQDRMPFGSRLWCDIIVMNSSECSLPGPAGPSAEPRTSVSPSDHPPLKKEEDTTRSGEEAKRKQTTLTSPSSGSTHTDITPSVPSSESPSSSSAAPAASGTGTVPAPAVASLRDFTEAEMPYRVQLTSLHTMGFTNRQLNLQLLQAHNGNIQTVCDFLLKALYN